MKKLRVVQLITDNREAFRDYGSPTPCFGTAPTALLQGFATVPDLEVHVVSCTQRPLHSPERLFSNVYFHSLLVPNLGWLKTGYQGCIRSARRLLQQLQPDLVHAQGTERDCALSGVWSGFPNLLTIHGNMRTIARVSGAKPWEFDWLAARLESIAIAQTEGVVCLTQYAANLLGKTRQRRWIVPNAAEAFWFETPRSPGRTILVAANIQPRKNQVTLINELAAVGGPGDCTLLFLGRIEPETKYGQEFMRLIRQYSWCQYGGFADRPTVQQHFAQARALVLPTLEDNCPMVVLEAMAAGMPVLANGVGGIPELIQHGHSGTLTNPADPEQLAAATKKVAAHPAEFESMARRAQEEARRRFHPSMIAARHIQIYRELLNTV